MHFGRAPLVNFQVQITSERLLFLLHLLYCLRLLLTIVHPLHTKGSWDQGDGLCPDLVCVLARQPAQLLCPAASPPGSFAEGWGGDPTGKLHGAQAVLWYPIQRINTTFCSLDAAASWPSVHIQFAHFLSALTCVNLLKRLSLKEQTNREMNRRLCWLWRGRLLLFPCFRECGPLQYIQCCLSALLSQMRALL